MPEIEIVWVDPPAVARGEVMPEAVQEALKRRPGHWARIATRSSSSLVTKLAPRFPQYEFTYRKKRALRNNEVVKVGIDIYARWMG